jgi:SNF2 family DNA or RNA helicase
MTQVYRPRDYQRAMLQHLCDHRRVNVWGGMGVGKTVVVLTYLDWQYNLLGERAPTLIVGPLRVVQSVWPEEQRKWAHLKDLRISVVVGDRAQRTGALQPGAQVYCINYENLPWLGDWAEANGWPFGRVVADESTKLKSFRVTQGGKWGQVLGRYAFRHCTDWVNLTGTPAPNGLKDLWGQAWYLDHGRRLGLSYSAFERRYFAFQKTKDHEHGISITLPFAQEQIEAALADITLTVRAADFMDLPPLIENTIKVELPKAAMKQYKEFQREMFIALADGAHEVEAFNAASLSMKCLQLASGAVYIEGGPAYTWVHDAKLEALKDVIEEAAGMPVLVSYFFQSDLDRILKAIPGSRHLDKNPQTIVDWNAGRIPVMVAQPGSAGHGLNLQDGGNILVYFSSWWDLEKDQQILERIGPTRQKQSGYDRPVFVHRIVAKGTIDEVVVARLKTKCSVQDALLEAMAAEPNVTPPP